MTRSRDIADQQKNLGGAVAPFVAGKNVLINGGFDIWQRGTSFTADATYTADRWIASMQTSNATFTQITSSLPTGFTYGIKVQRNSGSTSTTLTSIAQAMETINSIPLQGQKVTLSFWAKKGANLSDAVGQIFVRMYSGTGTNQGASSYGGWTGYTEWQDASSVTPTTSWARYSVTGTVPSSATQIGIRLGYGPTGTAGADDSFSITGVQLEQGFIATPFARAGGNIQGELAACQRYYFRNSGASTNNVILGICGSAGSSTTPNFVFQPPVTMRVAPTSVDFANIQAADQAAGYALSAVAINSNSQPNVITITATATGLTAYRPLYINASAASAYLGFSAEL